MNLTRFCLPPASSKPTKGIKGPPSDTHQMAWAARNPACLASAVILGSALVIIRSFSSLTLGLSNNEFSGERAVFARHRALFDNRPNPETAAAEFFFWLLVPERVTRSWSA